MEVIFVSSGRLRGWRSTFDTRVSLCVAGIENGELYDHFFSFGLYCDGMSALSVSDVSRRLCLPPLGLATIGARSILSH
eukprot:16434679-Heterocapsa_arctica.AAC.1